MAPRKIADKVTKRDSSHLDDAEYAKEAVQATKKAIPEQLFIALLGGFILTIEEMLFGRITKD